ncbi:MAG: hypothetical protein M3R27_12525 [Bacteroidota bacterium]|nr:hypothetical protein [Bacteroidota bacterium]
MSDGSDMVKTVLQELCIKNLLSLEARMVQVDKGYSRKRLRYFLILQPIDPATEISNAEKFLLDAFKKGRELGFAHLRNYLKFHFKKDLNKFKNDFVLKDLKKKGYCWFSFLPTGKGLRAKRIISKDLKFVNKNINLLLKDLPQLKNKLIDLGPHIILLEKDVIKRIKTYNKDLAVLNSLNLDTITRSLETLDPFLTLGAFDSIDSYDFSSDGFDGFGGGDFGGGGDGGDW